MRLDETYWLDPCHEIEGHLTLTFSESENEIKSEEDNYLAPESS